MTVLPGPPAVERQILPPVIEQKFAKRYLPPNASIWRDNIGGAWNGHPKPSPRISERFNGNEQDALRRILKRLWETYLLTSGELGRLPMDF